MDEKKIQEVFSDEAFVTTLFEAETAEEVQALVKEKGLEISLEEIEAIKSQLAKVNSGEGLSADELDDVAGGAIIAIPGLVSPIAPVLPINLPIMITPHIINPRQRW